MKREDLLRHLRRHGCQPLREGGRHSVWENPANGRQASIPRHREINDYTAGASAGNWVSQSLDNTSRPEIQVMPRKTLQRIGHAIGG